MPTHPSREESALGALAQLGCVDPARAAKVLDETGVTPADFGGEKIPELAKAIETLVRRGRAPEVYAVADLARWPVPAVAEILASANAQSWSVPQLLQDVRQAAKRRRAVAALMSAQTLLADPTKDLGTAVSEAISSLQAVAEVGGIRRASEDLMALMEHVEQVAAGKREAVLETGLPDLDRTIGGLQPTLTVIGSEPGVGKSGLLAALMLALARRGILSGFISLEDVGRAAILRMVSLGASVPVFVLANRPLHTEQRDRVTSAAEKLYQPMNCLLVDDRAGLSTTEVVATARAMVTQGAKALFIDHLGEIRLERSDRHDLDISDALQQLRALAKTYNVPVVVLCHLKRREGVEKEPKLTDFAFSAGVERMARVALGLTRKDDELKVHVLKQTQGASGLTVTLNFDQAAAMVSP